MATERDRGAIELIYVEYVAEEESKHGTKYEILAPIVFNALQREHRVVHDAVVHGAAGRTPPEEARADH